MPCSGMELGAQAGFRESSALSPGMLEIFLCDLEEKICACCQQRSQLTQILEEQ